MSTYAHARRRSTTERFATGSSDTSRRFALQMNVSNLTYPDGYTEPSESRVDDFEDLVWYNSEVCNNCFQRIRVVGDVVEKRTTLGVHKLRTEYDRTEHGSQEFDPFALASDRYGQCYCLDCGADTKAEDDPLPLSKMTRRGVALSRYINKRHQENRTDAWVDGKTMARTIKDLKRVEENTGYDSEIFAVATIRAIEAGERMQADDPKAVAV